MAYRRFTLLQKILQVTENIRKTLFFDFVIKVWGGEKGRGLVSLCASFVAGKRNVTLCYGYSIIKELHAP